MLGRHLTIALGCCLAQFVVATSLPAQALASRSTGAHYELQSQGSAEEAADFLNCLEAAFPQYAEFYGKTFKVSDKALLRVYFYETPEEWNKGMEMAGAANPGPAGGYYCLTTRAVFFYRQPSRSFTRRLMLEMCAYQFWAHASGHKRSPTPWFAKGAATLLSDHLWDGAELKLGAPPLISLENYAGVAKSRIATPKFDYRSILNSVTREDTAVHLAAIRLILSDPAYRRAMLAIRPSLDKGAKISAEEWSAALGPYKRFEDKLIESVIANQEPFAVGHMDWEGRRADRDEKTGETSYQLLGQAPWVSAARCSGEVKHLECSVAFPEEGGRAGLLLDWIGPTDYQAFLVARSGDWVIQRNSPNGWISITQGKLTNFGPANRTLSMRVERIESADGPLTVRVSAAGTSLAEGLVRNCYFGVILDNGRYEFRNIRMSK